MEIFYSLPEDPEGVPLCYEAGEGDTVRILHAHIAEELQLREDGFVLLADGVELDDTMPLQATSLCGGDTVVVDRSFAPFLSAIDTGTHLDALPPYAQDHKRVVLHAIAVLGGAELSSASVRLRADYDVVCAALPSDGRLLSVASEELQDNKDVAILSLSHRGTLDNVSERLRHDHDVAIHQLALLFADVPDTLRDDPVFMLKAVQHNAKIYHHGGSASLDNKDVALAAVRLNVANLEYASERLRGDREVVAAAIAGARSPFQGAVLPFASEALQGDMDLVYEQICQVPVYAASHKAGLRKASREFILRLVRVVPVVVMHCAERAKDDLEIMTLACGAGGSLLEYASARLKKDRGLVLQAVQHTGIALRYADTTLQHDAEIARAAVKQSKMAYLALPGALKRDAEIVASVLKHDPAMKVFFPTVDDLRKVGDGTS